MSSKNQEPILTMFMGKRADNGKWSVDRGCYISDFGKSYLVDYLDGLVEVEHGSVGQYIGKSDCDGFRIFEGHWLTEKMKVDGKMVDTFYPVVYSEEEAAFCLDMSYGKNGTLLIPIHEEDISNMRIGGHMFDRKEVQS